MTQPKSKRVPRAVREQEMLDAAVEVFARDGYHPAGVNEIAQIAGISKPMVYLYFGSKEELFVACIRREAARLREMIGRSVGDADAPPRDQLWSALRAFFGFVAEHRGAWSVLVRRARAQGSPVSDEVAELRDQMVDTIAVLLVRAAAGAEQTPAPPG
ncbi:MAG: TetR/AcrR family transcriptional regulator, partial [Stackebrandtia sp.]